MPSPPDDARAELQQLQQNIGLQLISRDHAVNRALIGKGYTDVLDIAGQPASLFAAGLRGTPAEQSARVLYERAVQQRRILGNLATHRRVEEANGFATAGEQGARAAAPSGCGCQSAVGPLAYLTDLLDYAVRHVTVDGRALTLGRLAEAFGQPFADLPTDCAAAEDPVRQVRLCVEVLHDRARRSGEQRVRDQVQAALDRYVPAVYDRLLLELGTSRQRLRALRSAGPAAREQAAEGLGIAAQHLNELLVSSTALNEEVVERLFGLPGTARDPLSTGAKLGDARNQLRRWRLRGVTPGRNVDSRGRLYLSLIRTGDDHRVTLSRSRRQDSRSIVAAGRLSGRTGTVALEAVNGSGLTGTVAVRYVADDRNIEIAVVPELLARRLTHLDQRWQAEDWPPDADGSDLTIPLVDPDLLTDADLVKPFTSNLAHRLLTARADEVAQLRRELDGQDSLAAMLTLTWAGDGAVEWLADWQGIWEDLQGGDPAVVQERLELLAERHLTAERFAFLHALRQREADQPLVVEERDQALEVLTDVRKQQRFSAWRQEEATAGLTLTPSFFCLTGKEPALHPVRADPAQRVAWRQALERNCEPPIIDPDLLPQAWCVSQPAATRWAQRRPRSEQDGPAPEAAEGGLAVLEAALRAAVDAGNLELLLTTGGDLPGEERPVFHGLGFTEDELAAITPARAQGRPLAVSPEQHGLTLGELIALAEIRALGADADADDRERVVHLLVQAEKRRWLFPRWRAEEQADGITLSPTHFRILPPPPTGPASPTVAVSVEPEDAAAQRSWRERLSAREEQQQLAIDGLRTAVERAEEAVLPSLRDALIDAVVTEELIDLPDSLSGVERREQQQRWVTNTLLIDAFEGGCRTTTRVAQAAETIQLLLWALRGQHLETGNFELESEHFDEDWRWLGSYATWRAAMFVFLYPENLLEPSLRPQEEQSELFQAIARALRGDIPAGRDDNSTRDEDPTGKLAATIANSVQRALNEGGRQGEREPERLAMIRTIASKVLEQDYKYAPGEVEYYLPLLFAVTLQRQGRYDAAHDWFSKVVDARSGALRPEARQFVRSLTARPDHEREEGWLRNLNPHKLAATRTKSHRRHSLITVVQCLLDHAETEFTADTAESLARARELYLTAQRLLENKTLNQHLADDGAPVGRVIAEMGESAWAPYIWAVLSDAVGPDWRDLPAETWTRLRKRLSGVLSQAAPARPSEQIRAELDSTIREVLVAPPGESLQARLQHDQRLERETASQLLGDTRVFDSLQLADGGSVMGSWVPAPRRTFCVPPNPQLIGLRLRLETGLAKLRNCLNISGFHREVPAYSAPTDARSGAPAPGSRGLVILSPVQSPPPSQYRYRALVDRAKQLLGTAQQLEASYLSFLERRDSEEYSLLRARQDLDLAAATVRLQALRAEEAAKGEALALKQYNRASDVHKHYQKLVTEGLSDLEEQALFLQLMLGILQGATMAIGAIGGAVLAGAPTGGAAAIPGLIGGAAGAAALTTTGREALSAMSAYVGMLASFERRKQEWEFQRDLAKRDLCIAEVQKALAACRKEIVGQEEIIAVLAETNAQGAVEFLRSKFTNAELYEWMSGVLGQAYRFFLQQATSVAKLAQQQLAFERQEPEGDFVLNDYWTPDGGQLRLLDGEESPDRRGLTGSARLLQDLYRLDQHAFLTDRRRLQLSKTISLALHDPVAFEQFRTTGVLSFTTSLELFDRDFPGHYARLIKRVRVSVIALIPPTEGIKATLEASGISRVVRAGPPFQEVEIVREPELVALSSPINATGVFELQEQPELLLPFEGTGVATSWSFRMPRAANPLDYRTVADVLVTIDYTALHSPELQAQVIDQLGNTVTGERPFSLRREFADAWYDLHHPDLVEPPGQPLRVALEIRPADFPPNLQQLRVRHVTLLLVPSSDATGPVPVKVRLELTAPHAPGSVGGAVQGDGGVLSTRRGNAGSWAALLGRSPYGRWTLALEDTEEIRALLGSNKIEDIVLVITYSGELQAWPG